MASAEDPEDPSKKFIESLDELSVSEASATYNITGKSAAHVIAILKSIVNSNGYPKGKVFIFEIGNPPTISFSLRANPSDRQPGNGVIYRTGESDAYRYNQDFVKELNKQYSRNTSNIINTSKFAEDVRRVFKNNSELLKDEDNKIIQDVYFILLFEIGRRLARDDKNVAKDIQKEKQDYDSLPISGAITKILKLFEEKQEKDFGFADVFLKKKKYHCFSDDPETRREAIGNLQLEELQLKDIEEMFGRITVSGVSKRVGEEVSSEGTTGTDSESSEGPGQ